MKKKSTYNILIDRAYENIVEVIVKKKYFMSEYSFDFDIDIIIISTQLKVITDFSSNLLVSGSRVNLKKNTINFEKTGNNDVFFLSTRSV